MAIMNGTTNGNGKKKYGPSVRSTRLAGRHRRCDARTLTCGDVARALNVAPRTVAGWVDHGHLKGFRLPSSKSKGGFSSDRRVLRKDAVDFCVRMGVPVPPEWEAERFLYVGPPLDCLPRLAEAAGLTPQACHDGLTAGIAIARWGVCTKLAVVSLALGRAEMLAAARLLWDHHKAPILLLANEDESEDTLAGMREEFGYALKGPHHDHAISQAVAEMMARWLS